MGWLRRLFGWNDRQAHALREELAAHRAFVEDELRRAGWSAVDAAAESRRRLGNLALAREDSREVWTLRWLDQARLYLRYGMRGLRREPLFALTAILTLALGTGATTTVFSVVDAEIWRPLPYPDPHRLVAVYSEAPDGHGSTDGVSLTELTDWRRAPGLTSLASSRSLGAQAIQLSQAESVSASVTSVTANYFATLGLRALRGRVFADQDAHGAATAILSDRGWTRMYNRDPEVVGRAFTLDGKATAIVGIVADDDMFGPGPELFVPTNESPAVAEGPGAPAVFWSIGRLAPGATAAAVRSQIQAAVDRHAAADITRRGHSAVVRDLNAFESPLDRGKLYFFLGAAILVLLLTVTNTAGLVLSRVLRRAPEFALRGALGGGQRAIAMQLVVEAALVVVPGCLLGLAVAAQVLAGLGRIVPEDVLLRGTHIPLDERVVLCCGAIALATLAGLAILPLGLARRAAASAIGAGGRLSALPSAGRSRAVLLTSQLALTLMLLAGAAMLLKSFVALLHVRLGFEPTSAWSAFVRLSGPRYAGNDQRRAYGDRLVEQALAIPGVRSAAIATSSPLNSGWLIGASDVRKPLPPGQIGVDTIYRAVGGDYFRTIGTPILRGRALGASDNAASPGVAVVNQVLADKLFSGEDPVGQRLDLVPAHGLQIGSVHVVTIVGVASNIKEISPNEIAFADIYVPFAQHPSNTVELLVRGPGGDPSTISALRAAAAAVDPTMPVRSTASLTDRVASSMRGARFNLTVVVGLAAAAVLIAAIGLYGAMAYAATARWREYGVRMALGATPRELIGRALWQAARLGLVGGTCGLLGALLVAKWLGDSLYLVERKHSGILYNVSTTDVPSLASALVGVVVLALLAGALPARRVSRIDPVKALRAE
jgi:predicted permease